MKKLVLKSIFFAAMITFTATITAEKKLVSPLEGTWQFVAYEMEYRDGGKIDAEDAKAVAENMESMLKAKRSWVLTEDKEFETYTTKAIYLPMVIRESRNGKEYRQGRLRFDTPRNFRFYWDESAKAEKYCYIRKLDQDELVFVHTSDTASGNEARHIVYRFRRAGKEPRTEEITKPEKLIVTAEAPKEGFADDDTYIVSGSGNSPGAIKSPLQAEAAAKEMARIDAQRKFAELVRNDDRACGQGSQLTAEMKNILGATRDGKVVHIQCSLISTPPSARECKLWIAIRVKGLKKFIDERRQDGRGQAASCGE